MKSRFKIDELHCANCAQKIEEAINEMDEIEEARINFANKTLYLKTEEAVDQPLIRKINQLMDGIESGVRLLVDEPSEKDLGEEPSFIRFIFPLFLFGLSFLFDNQVIKYSLLALAYLGAGGSVVLAAVKNIRRGQVFDENFLMTVASLGAILIGEYSEGVAVMAFYSIGEYFQDLAVGRSRKSIADLMDIRPEIAHVEEGDQLVEKDPAEVALGDIILVKPGERIPLDGVIIEGQASLDTVALTGESLPREVGPGDQVLSGSVNLNQLLKIKVENLFEDSAVAKILELVEESGAKKAETEQFISRFSRVYTPAVVFFALALALLPPLFGAGDFSTWIYRALVFLVASCPCALVVSIPLGFFAGIGRASQEGILIKGGNYLEALNEVDRFVFDKTGTLTEGVFELSKIHPRKGVEKDTVLKAAMIAESLSNHPIADSIRQAYQGELIQAESIEDFSGEGILAHYQGSDILAGNDKLMERFSIPYEEGQEVGTVIYTAVNNQYLGRIVIEDQVKDEADRAMKKLHRLGIDEIRMLTGDHESVAKEVSHSLKIDQYQAELLPQDKVAIVEEMLAEEGKGKLAFVGDGINDAPVLILADIGIAMGQVGSDAAIEAADIVVMKDDLMKLPRAIKISGRTMKIVWQNIIFALGIKAVVLILGALGIASMWMAVFADTGVALLAILNVLRILRGKY